jgi:Protein of unknown function (DUF3592)
LVSLLADIVPRRNRQSNANPNYEAEFEVRQNNMTVRPRPPLKLILGLIGLLLLGLSLFAGGATDVYRASVLFRRIRQQKDYQIANGTVLHLEHPWFAFSFGRTRRIWYRVHYRFAVPEGRMVEGEDWARNRKSHLVNILVAYQASDPSSNRIYEEGESFDLWLQAIAGAACLLAGAFLVFFCFTCFRMAFW